jgi:hypothetical protein
MKYQQLVVNGCSYMESYASGLGHQDLAEKLNIPQAMSLAIGGSANSRIIRTTLKHSYITNQPTLYVLGMTFLSRIEIPILMASSEFEGRWTNFQNQSWSSRWDPPWTQADSDAMMDLKLKWEINSILDRAEDLMYHMIAMIHSLKSRGHAVVVYQQADNLYQQYLNHPRLKLFQSESEIVDGYRWCAVPWQHEQGVPPTDYGAQPQHTVPVEIAHRQPGHHQKLNIYLTAWINNNNLLK